MPLTAARRVLRIEAEAIRRLIPRLDHLFEKAVETLDQCRGRVVVTGMGKSGIIGRKIAATLASTGTPALFLHAGEGLHGDLGMVARGDVLLAVSNSGETAEIIRLLPLVHRLRIPVISFTGDPRSTLARRSLVSLDVSVEKEACPMNLAPTASTTAALALGDALAVALLERRGFEPEDFARFHPGGRLGKLLLTVEDVMHRGREVPVVTADAPMKKAIAEMTAKKLGITTVVDGRGRLAGVVTDGDLRRALERDIPIADRTAGEIMGRNPKTIAKTDLAALAVARMEEHQITALIIAGRGRKVEGIIHLHDLMKAGVV
ncbi:MAG: KpsF/GutQ family sugar-phosphate isomerase [Nitrospirae bacterium]|nr:KpsF/GutQ family sugar-phosphate isomerase [Nitrospirota bacterium]